MLLCEHNPLSNYATFPICHLAKVAGDIYEAVASGLQPRNVISFNYDHHTTKPLSNALSAWTEILSNIFFFQIHFTPLTIYSFCENPVEFTLQPFNREIK